MDIIELLEDSFDEPNITFEELIEKILAQHNSENYGSKTKIKYNHKNTPLLIKSVTDQWTDLVNRIKTGEEIKISFENDDPHIKCFWNQKYLSDNVKFQNFYICEITNLFLQTCKIFINYKNNNYQTIEQLAKTEGEEIIKTIADPKHKVNCRNATYWEHKPKIRKYNTIFLDDVNTDSDLLNRLKSNHKPKSKDHLRKLVSKIVKEIGTNSIKLNVVNVDAITKNIEKMWDRLYRSYFKEMRINAREDIISDDINKVFNWYIPTDEYLNEEYDILETFCDIYGLYMIICDSDEPYVLSPEVLATELYGEKYLRQVSTFTYSNLYPQFYSDEEIKLNEKMEDKRRADERKRQKTN